MGSYVRRELFRNPRRTLVSVFGVGLSVAFVVAIAFFVDASAARMTEQAVRPVTVDMQFGVANPLASSLAVEQLVSPHGPFQPSQRVSVAVTVRATNPATGLMVKDPGNDRSRYAPGSTRVNGVLVADALPATSGDAGAAPATPAAPPTPVSPLVAGVALPNLPAGGTATVTYDAVVTTATANDVALGLAAAATSVQDPIPAGADAHPALDVTRLATAARAVPGVKAAEPFILADFPTGALRTATGSLGGPLKVVSIDQATYTRAFPVIRTLDGSATAGTATLSRRAADGLGVSPGGQIQLTVPGRPTPATLTVGAVVDLTRADQLFASRSADTLGDPVRAPYVLALDPTTYQSVVLPGLRADAASKTPTAQPPVSELHVAIDRRLLQADPAKALVREQGLRRTVERLAPGDLSAIDNLNSALSRASRDAIMAKGLFLLLGLPGVLLAAAVARYAAGLLAEGQRRERALLRARGFGPAALRRSLALSTVVIGLGGTIVGLVVGGVAANALLPLSHVGGRSFVLSVVLAVVTAAATAAAAIYVPGRRSLVEEVADERRSMVEGKAPRWLVARADIALLLGSGIVALVAYFAGGYKVTAAASEGQSVALSFFFLLCPLFAWLGVTLLVARGLLGVAGRLGRRRGDSNLVGRLGRRTLSRSLIRRARPAVSGVCVIALATAFTVALAVFVTTYRHEQRVDARFVTGGDLRVALGATTNSRQDLESRLRVPGVTAVSPIASTPSAQVGNEKNLSFAGIDPTRFGQLQVLESGFSNQTTPSQALAALANDPNAVLMDRETAKTLNLHVGDVVRVDLPNVAQGRPISTRVRVAGIHIYFPGFPTGVDFIGNLSTFEKVTGAQVDSYGLRIAPGTDPRAVATALDAGPGRDLALRVDTTKTAINRDQSTIAALNLGSLGSLGRAFGLVLGATGAAVFVFGVLLTRRREHITLRALGLGLPKVAGIVLGEAAAVAGIALVVGTAIGVGMAAIDVQILRSLFVIPPHGLTAGVTGILGPTGIVVVGVALALIAGYAGLARSRLVEILRED